MWQLVRGHLRDWRVWPMSVVVACGTLIEPTFAGFPGLVMLTMFLPAVLLPNASLFESALPVSRRAVKLSRWTAALVLTAPVVMMALIETPFPVIEAFERWRVAGAWMVLVVAMSVVYLAPDSWSQSRLAVSIRVLAIMVSGGVLLLELPAPLVLPLLGSIAALTVFVMIARIEASPTEAAWTDHSSSAVVTESQAGEIGGGIPWRAVLHSASNRMIWILPILGLTVGASEAVSGPVQLVAWICGVSLFARQRNVWMLCLPISHRSRLLLCVTPALFLGFGAAAVGSALPENWLSSSSLTYSGPVPGGDDYGNKTSVAITYWQRFDGENQPRVTAPWGESIAADTLTIMGIQLYNPFTTDKAHSSEFVEWQFERATAAVFGKTLSVDEYRTMMSKASRPLRITQQPRVRLLRLSVLVVLTVLALWLLEIGRWRGFWRARFVRIALVSSLFLTALSPLFLDVYFSELHNGGNFLFPLLNVGILRLSSWLPASTPLAIVLCLLPAVALYFLLEWQFKRSDRTSYELAFVPAKP